MKKQSQRSPKKIATTWELKRLFENDDDPKIEKNTKTVEQKNHAFINKWKNRKDYLNDPAVLKKALDEYEALKKNYGTDGDAGYYFWLRTQIDRNNTDLKAKYNKIEEFSRKLENEVQFFHLRIARIPKARQAVFLKYPGLKKYRHFLERIFAEAQYMLGENEEKILNLKTATSYSNWVRMTSDFLAKEERKVLLEDGSSAVKTLSEISSLTYSKNRKVRDIAAAAFNAIMEQHVDVAEVEINSILANKKVDDELRKVARPDLLRHISDDVESEMVDSLVKAVSDRFHISADYYKLKSRLLGVRRLRYHERNVEIGDIDLLYPYEKSIKLIYTVFNRLDSKFTEILTEFIENSQFDVHPRKGKGSGAFCVHHLIAQPTYILLNHTDKLRDVLTLAHELGHGVNNELIREKQNALNFGTPTSTAEVASTFMEDFVLQEILREADDELKFSIMVMKLNDDVSTIFRQIACYTFEQELHQEFRQKGYLSKQEIGKLFQKHMAAYMGDFVEQSKGSENWWVYWNHIRYFFYVYSYAGGLLISKSLQNSVKKDPGFIHKVKGFLAAGLSDSPKNIFGNLGINIADKSFWDKGLDEIEALLEETTSLAKKLGKI
jgi:oligoendopeptidase F